MTRHIRCKVLCVKLLLRSLGDRDTPSLSVKFPGWARSSQVCESKMSVTVVPIKMCQLDVLRRHHSSDKRHRNPKGDFSFCYHAVLDGTELIAVLLLLPDFATKRVSRMRSDSQVTPTFLCKDVHPWIE